MVSNGRGRSNKSRVEFASKEIKVRFDVCTDIAYGAKEMGIFTIQ